MWQHNIKHFVPFRKRKTIRPFYTSSILFFSFKPVLTDRSELALRIKRLSASKHWLNEVFQGATNDLGRLGANL